MSFHGVYQRAQDVFVFIHEKMQVASIFRNRDLVLLDNAIYGR
jgi:hypothetical protein